MPPHPNPAPSLATRALPRKRGARGLFLLDAEGGVTVNRTRNRIRFLLACAALLFPVQGASAAEAAYPVRPIRMIVPFVAGGGTDLLARLLSPRLGEVLGQQIVIDNRGGGASILGTQLLAKAPPDGYTIAMMDTAFAINPGFAESLPYNVERDFAYVAIIATNPTVLVARSSLKARTIQDLIAAAKAKPGSIKAASAGIGSSSHLSIEMLSTAAKVRFLHVPYKGAGAAIQDMLGGHADFTFAVPGSVVGQIQSGAFVALAVNKATNVLPNTPTFASTGIPMLNPEAFR